MVVRVARSFIVRAAVTVVLIAGIIVCAGSSFAYAQDGEDGGDNAFQETRNSCQDWFTSEEAVEAVEEEGLAAPPDFIGGTVCNVLGAVAHPGDAIETVKDSVPSWDGKLAGIVREIKDGNPAVIGFTMSLWTKYKLDTDALTVSSDGINNIMWQLALAGLAISVLVGLARVAASRRQGSGQSLEGAAKGYGQYLLYGALVPALAIPAIMAFDAFADTLINEYVANDGDFSKITDAATIGEEMNPILVLVFVLISLMGSLMMALAMVMRIILLPILIGLMPIFAAWAVGRAGKFTVENAMSVLVSFALLKVAAALVYMAAVWAALSLDGSEENKLIALVIFGATGLCAPALITMIMPMMRGQTGGSATAATGSALGGAGAAVGGAVAGGAVLGGGAMAAGSAAMHGAGSASSSAGSAMGLSSGGGPSGGGRSGGASGSGGGPSGGGPSTGGGGSGGAGGGPSTGGGGGAGRAGGGAGAGRGGSMAGASGGPGAGSRSQTAARIARNGGAMAGSATRAMGGILDDSVGAPAHPSRAYM